MRRQTAMPLAVTLTSGCQGYPNLCLMEEYLGVSCEACCLARPENAGTLMASAGDVFRTVSVGDRGGPDQGGELGARLPGPGDRPLSIRGDGLPHEASPGPGRGPGGGGGLWGDPPNVPPPPGTPPGPPVYPLPPSQRSTTSSSPPGLLGRGRIWLEVRDYAEAAALSREWREPLVLALTPDNYAAFLQEHRHWDPRRLLWRLPPAIPESALAFYQKALETLSQGGYNRFLAGDWSGVALAGAAGGQVFGDQTLGVRNSWSVETAREVKVNRVCLPPGHRSDHWQEILAATPFGSFWSYLYRCAALAVCP